MSDWALQADASRRSNYRPAGGRGPPTATAASSHNRPRYLCRPRRTGGGTDARIAALTLVSTQPPPPNVRGYMSQVGGDARWEVFDLLSDESFIISSFFEQNFKYFFFSHTGVRVFQITHQYHNRKFVITRQFLLKSRGVFFFEIVEILIAILGNS